MTKEELKKEAEEYRKGRKDLNYFSEPYKQKIERAYLAGAKPREKRIAELEEKNIELLGKLAFTENALNNAKAQIEKIKCCGNCARLCECSIKGFEECKNYDKWELRENDRQNKKSS